MFGWRDPNHSSTPEIMLLFFKLLGTISCDGHIARQCATNMPAVVRRILQIMCDSNA